MLSSAHTQTSEDDLVTALLSLSLVKPASHRQKQPIVTGHKNFSQWEESQGRRTNEQAGLKITGGWLVTSDG